jgi:Nose resistant-to-fluoxetine protein, N-terminal domain
VHDANAKLPSGVFQGNIHQYGDFDQCLDSVSPNEDFQGRYCLTNVFVQIPDDLKFLKSIKEEMVLVENFKSTLKDVSSTMNILWQQ